MKRTILATAAIAALSLGVSQANDGFGGLTATGLQFDKTGVVQMLSEDLYLSLKSIRVSYVFRHKGDSDVTGEIIFPLPPISVAALAQSDFAIDIADLDRPNFVNFTAKVDGRPVQVKADRIAVVEPPYDENRPASSGYTAPGRDVTASLRRHGVPLTLDPEKLTRAIASLPQASRAALQSEGLVEAFEGDGGTEYYPAWSIIERYHWTQTFRAGADTRIEHAYDGAFPGGIFGWSRTTERGSYQETLIDKYCIDAGTQRAIMKALTQYEDGGYGGMAYYVDYVLTTANTWAGPIGDFKLTIDKGHPKNVISLCVNGIKKTGPTTFVVEKKNFAPDRDISILLVPGVDTPPR